MAASRAASTRMTLCAGGFGLSRDTSATIAELAASGRINAIGCVTTAPGWQAEAALLHDLRGDCQIGLHVVLTDTPSLSEMPVYAPSGIMPGIAALRRQSALRNLPRNEIGVEVACQFKAFMQAMGRAPDFVDSKQQVHLLPGLGEIVLEEMAWYAPGAWVRSGTASAAAGAGQMFSVGSIAAAWRSRRFARAAASFGLTVNDRVADHCDVREVVPQVAAAETPMVAGPLAA